MTVTTKDGQSVSIKAGETVTLKTNSAIDELYVKRFGKSQAVKTGIAEGDTSESINLELFHDLPVSAMYLMLAISGLLLIAFISGIFSYKRQISITLYLMLIALIVTVKQGSITLKQL